MNNKVYRKKPSLIRHTRDSLGREMQAWKVLIQAEWKWILSLIFGLVILIACTRPLPPNDVYLAVGQQGSIFETMGKKLVPYFAKEGVQLHLVHTKGSASSLADLAATKGQFPNLLSLGSIEYVPLWLFYRGQDFQGSGVFAHFASKRISVGVDGSAEKIIIGKLLNL